MIKTFDYPVYYKVEINEETGEVKIFSSSKHAKGREMAQFLNPSGYLRAKMNNKGVQIHQLVALFYLGKRKDGMCVNHKDGNKLNNRPSNLEYVTIAENIKHAVIHGMHVCNDPKRSGRYKDGRAVDHNKYKKEWYIQNRERILVKAKERYQKSKG
jgi:hypothetical protein